MIAPISVITPTFNEEKTLPLLLDSLTRQTTPPAEIIISDVRSTDTTRKIAKKYGCKIADDYPKEGPGQGRNRGALLATQSILLFLDADVIIEKNFLEDTLAEFKRKNLDIASCLIRPLSKSKFMQTLTWFMNRYFEGISFLTPRASGYCIFIRRELHQKIHGFDKTVLLAEDHEYAARATKFGKFGYLYSHLINVSVRRFKENGFFSTFIKYFICELYILFIGPVRKPLFKFAFGKHNKN